MLVTESAEQALYVWRASEAVDCLLTDVVMPGKNGVQLASELRASGFEGAILFMSGFADRSILDEVSLSGAWFLAKPFTRAQLLETLSDALESLSPRAIG